MDVVESFCVALVLIERFATEFIYLVLTGITVIPSGK